jgi:hypothetical protein
MEERGRYEHAVPLEPLKKCGRKVQPAPAEAGKPGPPGISKQPGQIFDFCVNFVRGSLAKISHGIEEIDYVNA